MSIPKRIREKDGEFQIFDGIRQDMAASFQPTVDDKFTNVDINLESTGGGYNTLGMTVDFQGNTYEIHNSSPESDTGFDPGVLKYVQDIRYLLNDQSLGATIDALYGESEEFIKDYLEKAILYVLNGGNISDIRTKPALPDNGGAILGKNRTPNPGGGDPMPGIARGVSLTDMDEFGNGSVIMVYELDTTIDSERMKLIMDYKVCFPTTQVLPGILVRLLGISESLILPELAKPLRDVEVDLPGAPLFMSHYPLEVDIREGEMSFPSVISLLGFNGVEFKGLKTEDFINTKIKIVSDIPNLAEVEPFYEVENDEKIYGLKITGLTEGQGYLELEKTINNVTYREKVGLFVYQGAN